NYSPVVSVLRANPVYGLGVEWRSDYDPLLGRIVNSTISADARRGDYFLSVGHTQVHSVPQLSPPANQFRGGIGFGNPNHRAGTRLSPPSMISASALCSSPPLR